MCPSSNTEMHSPPVYSLPQCPHIFLHRYRLGYSHTHWTTVFVHLDTHTHLHFHTTGTLVHCMRHFGAHILGYMFEAPQSLVYITSPISRAPPEQVNEHLPCFPMQVVSLRCS